MDLAQVVTAQFAIPVVFVILCVVLVFALGFKSVAEPTQEQLAVITDDRKSGAKKKKKPDNKQLAKPQSNGHIVQGREVTKKEDNAPKEVKVEPKTTPKAVKKEPVVVRPQEKTKGKSRKEDIPEDFFDGDWVQAVSKKDRKQKRKDDDSTGLLLTAPGIGLSSSEESTPSKKRKRGKKKTAESGEKKEDSDKSPGTDNEKVIDVPVQKETEVKTEKKTAEKAPVPPPQEKTPPPQEKKPADKSEKAAKPARIDEKPKKGSEKKSKKSAEEVKPEKEEVAAEIAPKEATPVAESKNATEAQDESKSKKKKKKKAATPESSPPPVAKVDEARLKPQVEAAPKSESSSNALPTETTGTVAFDELGDTEKDTKPQKKKKKARRD